MPPSAPPPSPAPAPAPVAPPPPPPAALPAKVPAPKPAPKVVLPLAILPVVALPTSSAVPAIPPPPAGTFARPIPPGGATVRAFEEKREEEAAPEQSQAFSRYLPGGYGLPLVALIFTILNAMVLAIRIRAENRALAPTRAMTPRGAP